MKKLYLLLTAITLLFAGQAMAAPGLTVTGKGVAPTNGKLVSSPDNRISGLVQSLTLTNTGDVTLNPGDEGYTLTLYSYTGDVDLQTYSPTVSLAPGEETTVEVTWEFDFTPLDAAYVAKNSYRDGKVWDTFRVRENVSNTKVYIGPWLDVYPYKAAFYLCTESSGTELDKPINFGFINKATTLKYRIRSTGAADVEVQSIELPEGFSATPATPFVVKGLLASSSDNYKTIEITVDPEVAKGVLSGDMTINVSGADPKTYKVQAVAMDENDLYESFEAAGTLKGWIVGQYWDRYELSTSLKTTTNKYAYQHSRSTEGYQSMLITPRLSFAEGSKMQFDAARISSYSNDTRMKVYWSPDRLNWTLLKTVTAKATEGAETLPAYGTWGTYTLDNIPAGEGYIAFEGLYIYLNDVYGGQIVDVDYDIYVEGFAAPSKGKVNDRLNTVLTVSNLLADKEVAADAYTVKLYADGELVDTATPVVIEAGKKNLTFELGYTPHKSGLTELKAEFTIGNDVFPATASVDVEKETSTLELTIGESKNTSYYLPLSNNYKSSASQSIYTAEMLAQYGLEKDMTIIGAKYEGYESTTKVIKANLKMNLRSVEESTIAKDSPYTFTDDDVYYSKPVTYVYKGAGSSSYYDFLDMTFDKPYVYDGKNLLIGVSSEEGSDYANVSYRLDTGYSNVSLYKRSDTYSTYLNSAYSTVSGIPVVKLLIQQTPATASGVVTDSKKAPVEGATVAYTSGDVLYTAVTDAEGKYFMEIYRPELEYTVSVDCEYYPVMENAGTVTFSDTKLDVVKNITLADFYPERIFNVTFHVTNDANQSMENIPFTLRSNNFSLSYTEAETTLDADGNATIKCFGGSHTITLHAPGMKTVTTTFGINKEGVKNFNLAEDVKAPYGIDADLNHNVFTGENEVALSWNNEVAAFSDDFESYKPFVIEFDPWTGIDGDKSAPAQLTGSYDHAGELNYGQIINPYAVEPMWDLNNYWTLAARSGRQYLGFIVRNDGKPLDDMVITPAITIGEDFTLRFYAKGSDRTNARFTVGITEKLTDPKASDFTVINAGNYIDAPYNEWTPVNISLADYAGKDVKIAIRCISEKGSFVSMIDDVFVGRLAPVSGMAKPKRSAGNPNESFIITLDGEEVGTTSDYCFNLKNVPYGTHTIGVQAKYVNTTSEVVTVPVTFNEDDYVKATVTLKTNNSTSPEGMTVNVSAISAGDNTSAYSTEADEDGVATFGSLPKGLYTINIQPKDFNAWQLVNDFSADQNINAYLYETLVTPFNLTADPEEQEDGTFNVLARWNQDLGFADGFESYADFATGTFGGWKTLDRNDSNQYSYPISLNGNIVTFPGCSTSTEPRSVAPMVFNPAATTPSMSQDMAIKAPEGDKLVTFQGPQAATADKWLISPSIEVRDDYEWSFLAKSYPTYPETLELLVSEDGSDNPADFKVVDTVSPSYEEWTQYTISVGQYAGKNVRFAIHCTTRDGFIAMVDDFKVGRAGGENVSSVGKVKNYVVTLDGTTVDSTSENSYKLSSVKAGSHKLGVLAHYESGYSELAELPFNLTSGVDGINAGSAVNVRGISGAILIDAPAGADITVTSAAGVVIASTVADGTQIRVEAGAGVYAVVVGRDVHKVIVR